VTEKKKDFKKLFFKFLGVDVKFHTKKIWLVQTCSDGQQKSI
jgi:hypothetical protein